MSFVRVNSWITRPLDISLGCKRLPVRHCIFWEYSGFDCPSQGVFTSSALQTIASQPCNNGSLCWSYFRASHRYLLDVCSEWTLAYLSLRICGTVYNKLYPVWSVGRNFDCNKRGQTSRLVVGTEIQTSCNFKANLHDRYYLMGFARSLFSNVVLESLHNLMVWHHGCTNVSYNLDLLVHKDFPHTSSSPNASTTPHSTT